MRSRLLSTIVAGLLATFGAMAQNETVEGQAPALDSTLLGKNILSIMPSTSAGAKADVVVNQSGAITKALDGQIASNPSRRMTGYRVRIFNDNKQNSRGASEEAMNRFKAMFPGLSAYRTYSNPFFKVTVGDFRTKSEALQLLDQVKGSFPSAFIVKETINYPAVGPIL